MTSFNFSDYESLINKIDPIRVNGRVTQVVGLLIEATGPQNPVGDICQILTPQGPLPCEIVGFRRGSVLLMPLIHTEGIRQGSEVIPTGTPLTVPAGEELLGRLLDGLGHPIDDKGPLPPGISHVPINREPPNPFTRKRITEPLPTGVRAIDGLLTIGGGQRMGIFAGSGVGKSTLMGMVCRSSQADINVVALIGERGREVREFLEKDLGPEGMRKSIVVVATSDRPALVRVKAAFAATAIAEYFRDKGKNVMLMMDSVTRFALAQREIGLAVGEPPTTRGYTPSVFSLLPKLLERAGTARKGSITGIYTVLVEGGDMDEPVADAVRGILDGHLVLSRDLAHQNIYPAVDVLGSISRLMPEITSKKHFESAGKFRQIYSNYSKNADAISLGAYKTGSDPKIDEAIQKHPLIESYIKQGITEVVNFQDSLEGLSKIVG
ncbi:MAG: flagellum-specific synthase [Clostridiales bacterium]|jgi:flagellum-specific ATP synthase|nr:flagellum-specific synthase [Clostridiales bacterium]MDN5283251.1 flagellum-specific synthase [Candidatus Ozemobacter sp.]